MDDLRVMSLEKQFAGVRAVNDVSFDVAAGEMLVLLGPSGCGKSTTLRCLAGLEQPTSGTIRFGDRVIYDAAHRVNTPPHRRDLGLVFQNFALWPHMTAAQNIAFPLKRKSKSEKTELVIRVADMLDLDNSLLVKRPGKLSGGQQQRVALARALVNEPRVVLFDEPLSNLDAALREQLRVELRAMHQRIGFTGVYVTHDLIEGATLGDRVAVMRAGKIEQIGETAEVFERPATIGAARLVGYRELLTVDRDAGVWSAENGTGISFSGPMAVESAPHSVKIFGKPDRIRVQSGSDVGADAIVIRGAVVKQTVYIGSAFELILSLGDKELRVPSKASADWAAGDEVVLALPRGEVNAYSEDGHIVPHGEVFHSRDHVTAQPTP